MGGDIIFVQKTVKDKQGFTLIEIMIVVAVIAVITAIAIPNFIYVRERSRTSACMANLRQMSVAKSRLSVAEGLQTGDSVTMLDLVTEYIRYIPVCPAGGTYTINPVDVLPTCTVSGHQL